MRIRVLTVAALLVVSCNRPRPQQEPAILPMLSKTGPDVPPAGRSLFDAVIGERVPYPFTALLARIERAPSLKAVLVPLGRSLQRASASPQFFEFPRIIVTVDAETADGPYLKDRLFLGYQAKAAVIEVLSYNDEAGRFEFQLVENYKEGATPKLSYAPRAVCLTCHQNQGPIFPRPLWDETNANPQIAALLGTRHDSFHGVKVRQGVDVPYFIDNATDRANEFSIVQTLWAEGSSRWRAAVVRAALQYRLAGSRMLNANSLWYRTEVVDPAIAVWKTRWPKGLLIPSADIPNRDPLLAAAPETQADAAILIPALVEHQKHIDSQFEPNIPRGSFEHWNPSVEQVNRFVAGTAGFFSESDIRGIDSALVAKRTSTGPSVKRHEASCRIKTAQRSAGERVMFECNGGFEASGVFYHGAGRVRTGSVDRIMISGADPATAVVAAGSVGGGAAELRLRSPAAMQARFADGLAMASIMLRFSGTATLTVLDDAAPLRSAIAAALREVESGHANTFAQLPLRRASVIQALGLAAPAGYAAARVDRQTQ